MRAVNSGKTKGSKGAKGKRARSLSNVREGREGREGGALPFRNTDFARGVELIVNDDGQKIIIEPLVK